MELQTTKYHNFRLCLILGFFKGHFTKEFSKIIPKTGIMYIKSINNLKVLIIMHLLKILAFVARITAINNYHGTNQKRENRFLTNQKAAVIILAQ
jgi:hypothetical protein